MRIFISVKCSDSCDYAVVDDQGNYILEGDGYVPRNWGVGGGDYVKLTIDNETGKIVGWVPIDLKTLEIED